MPSPPRKNANKQYAALLTTFPPVWAVHAPCGSLIFDTLMLIPLSPFDMLLWVSGSTRLTIVRVSVEKISTLSPICGIKLQSSTRTSRIEPSSVPIETKAYYEILKELREDHDLKQSQVAAILGTTQQVYSRYEMG